MIYGYSGKPGAGKSYSVVEHVIIPSLKKGRRIYHNLQLNEDRLAAMCGQIGELIPFSRECTADELVASAPAGALIVIDESVRYWPSGIGANKVPKEQVEFFTMHRHRVGQDGRATDIVLVCQDFGSQCASFIRELIQYTYYAVKLSHLGLTKKYRLETYEGVVKGDSPPKSQLIRKTISKYRPEIYACYVSHTQSEKGVAGEELRDQAISVWKNWKVTAAIIAIFVAIGAVWGAIHSFRAFGQQTSRAAAGQAEHSEAGPQRRASSSATFKPGAAAAPVPLGPQPSKNWRLSGEIVVNGRRRILIDGATVTRFIPSSACKRDPEGNRTCQVDGQLVAEWTGPAAPPPMLNQWFTASAAPVEVKAQP